MVFEYGTGAVMGVPTHDERDWMFATKYNLEKILVIDNPKAPLKLAEMDNAYIDEGILINSGEFDGMNNRKAISAIIDWVEAKKIGTRKVNYRLRDWLISRQRYWGAPIPVIYCDKCGEVLVPEEDLPVLLPDDVEFKQGALSPARNAAVMRTARPTRWTRSFVRVGTTCATPTRTTRRNLSTATK